MSSATRDKPFRDFLRSDAPRPQPGASERATTTVSRRLGNFAWHATYGLADGELRSLVTDETAVAADELDDNGNCRACHRPFDETTPHGFPCKMTVTVTGRPGDE